MEADELELTKDELQTLIRDRVQKILSRSSAMNVKFNLLRSLLSRNQRQISQLSTVCQSVATCEQTVKELYSLLGWKYEDDSDKSDGEHSGCSRARPFVFVTSRRHVHGTPPFQTASSQSSNSEDEQRQERYEDCELPVTLKKKAVVVLTKLRRSQITAALRTPSPQPDSSNDDVINGSESDMQWEPETDYVESEVSGSDFEIELHKKRKIDTNYRRCTRTKKNSRRGRNLYRIVDSSTSAEGSTSSSESNGVEISPGEATLDDDDMTTEATVLQENTTKTTSQSEKRKTAEFEKNTTEFEKNTTGFEKNTTGFEKNTTGFEKNATEFEEDTTEFEKNTTEFEENTTEFEEKTTESEESKATESGKIKNTESEERKTMESRKRKTTKSDKEQTMESDKPKTIKANTSKTTPQANTKTAPRSNVDKTSTLPADNKGGTPANSQSQKTTNTSPKVPQVEITVNMNVLARRRMLSWKPGKITEIITRGDGKVKYKVVFEEKGKCLVSSHHIALVTLPQLDNLFIGARVVVKSEGDQTDFKPGILAEIPSRKNRMRFLVFIDDHTPVYCSLPSLHLVCKPLADPLDDIPDENHRSYMREYLNAWPYPPVTQYKIGQSVNVQYNGVLEKCEVVEIDCSLVQVLFSCDQQKEWIFRGSMRLEHIVNVRKDMLAKTN